MKKRLGLEALAFQSKNFGNELKLIVENIREARLPIYRLGKTKLIENLEDTIFKYTNLNISVKLSDTVGATYLLFAVLNIDSGIYHADTFNHITDIQRSNYAREVSKIRGDYEVNKKTGMVGGFYAKAKSELSIEYNELMMNNRFTSSEVVAILLHEIGHAFTQMEYGAKSIMTNQALAAIAYSLLNKNPPEKHLIYIRAAADLLDLPENGLDDIVDIKDSTIVSTVIVDRAITNKLSELGTPYYDAVAVEYLADQYVSRYGYGVHLASANYKAGAGLESTSRTTRSIIRITEICSFSTAGLLGAVALTVNPFAAFIMLYLVTTIIWYDGKAGIKNMSYDTLLVRNKRIREQTIERLKDLNAPKEEIVQLLNDYKVITKYIDKTREFSSLYNKALNLLFKSRRDANSAMALQRDIEELASNDLFATSAKLRTMY